MPQPDPLDLDLQICFPLYAASRAVTRAYGQLLAEVGLTYPQYLTLLALWGADGQLSVGALGERLRLASATPTPRRTRREAAGLGARRRDAADERRVLVELTAEGWAVRERVATVPMQLLATLDLSRDQADQLRDLLEKLLVSLDH